MRLHRGGQNIYHIGFEGTLTVRQGQAVDPYAAYLVYDTFTDTAGVHLHDHTPEKATGWADLNGVAEIHSNNAALKTTAGGAEGTVIDSGAANVTTISTMVLVVNSSHVFRAVDNNNYWLFGGTGNVWRLYKHADGGWELIGSGNACAAGTYTVKVITNGNTITGYNGASQELTTTNAFNNTATKHGLGWHSGDEGAEASTHDNYTVTSP